MYLICSEIFLNQDFCFEVNPHWVIKTDKNDTFGEQDDFMKIWLIKS